MELEPGALLLPVFSFSVCPEKRETELAEAWEDQGCVFYRHSFCWVCVYIRLRHLCLYPVFSGKMYVCQYCKAEFAQSIELTRHVRTHTGDRPYVCRECGKGYSQAHGLSVHLQTFHSTSTHTHTHTQLHHTSSVSKTLTSVTAESGLSREKPESCKSSLYLTFKT